MRQGQPNNKGMRNRNRNRKGPNPLSRSYESNGGDVKIRGTALHVAEKYVQLARDAQASGDRVASENYLQHAEHYYRIVAAAQAQMPQPQQFYRNDADDGDDEDGDNPGFGGNSGNPYQQGNRQPYQGGGQHPNQGQPQQFNNNNGGSEQPQFNGNAPAEQPAYEGQQDEPRADNANNGGGGNQQRHYNNNNQGGHRDGNFRGRRRRPYRDQYAGGGERGGNAPQSAEQPAVGFDAPQGEE